MTKIQDRYVDKARKLVVEKFPEMEGAKPSVSEKSYQGKGPARRSTRSTGSGSSCQYVLTFEREVSLPGGRSLKRLVRVTMDESGEVLKVISSK